ncbi:hypothetical protein KY311_03545 [Candidatus Woesearchaeota archaeon]|nr:hypothetical protein [Candidatus Woesearchaeota archaeon]
MDDDIARLEQQVAEFKQWLNSDRGKYAYEIDPVVKQVLMQNTYEAAEQKQMRVQNR